VVNSTLDIDGCRATAYGMPWEAFGIEELQPVDATPPVIYRPVQPLHLERR
jgi:hypothetical protein